METRLPAFIPKTWDLPDAIRRRLGDQAGRQRAMDEAGHLLLILHNPPRPEDNEVRHPAVFWLNPAGEWKSAPTAGGLSSLQQLLADFRTAVRQLDEKVDAAKTPRDYFDVMRGINPLLRCTRSLLSVMEDARKARPDERRLIILRDEAVETERGADLLANDARSGMEFSLAESGELQAHQAQIANHEARRLNRLVGFFFPLATLVAVFGMSDPSEVLRAAGFWPVVLLGMLLGLAVLLLIRRSRA
jgi:hypothetical protein